MSADAAASAAADAAADAAAAAEEDDAPRRPGFAPRGLAFSVLSADDIDAFYAAGADAAAAAAAKIEASSHARHTIGAKADETPGAAAGAARLAALCRMLKVGRYSENPRAAVFVDFCYANLLWAAQPLAGGDLRSTGS